MKSRRSEHAESQLRQEAIVRAALACFVENGYTDTGITDICRTAGASTGSVYHHFKSKAGLAAAVYLSGIRDYQAGIQAALKQEQEAREGIFAIVAFHLSWVARHPDWARFLFEHRHAEFMGGSASEETLRQLNARFAADMTDWFKGHIASGRLKPLPRDIFISLLLGPCQEYARLYLARDGAGDVDRAAVEIAKGVWAALTPDGSAGP